MTIQGGITEAEIANYLANTPGFFERHAEPSSADNSTKQIPSKKKFLEALKDLGVVVPDEEIGNLFLSTDSNGDGGINFQEFLRSVQMPSTTEQWVGTLPLAQVVSDVIADVRSFESQGPLRKVSQITPTELDVLCDAMRAGLKRLLAKHVSSLKASFEEMDKRVANNAVSTTKFQVSNMSVGNANDFHNGLSSRIGTHFCLSAVNLFSSTSMVQVDPCPSSCLPFH